MRRNYKKRIAIMLVICIFAAMLTFPEGSVRAAQIDEESSKQIVLLIDASKSMGSGGRWMSLVDSVLLINTMLPENYVTALLIYNTEVQYSAGFGELSSDTRTRMAGMELQGYTNPAAALEQAMKLFDTNADEKRVVFISDGEISMPQEEQTQEAVNLYGETVDEAAKQGIMIDMLIIPDDETENQILSGAEKTAGVIYENKEGQNLEETVIKYLFETLCLERIELGVSDTDSGSITADLQDIHMKNAKILLTAEQNIEKVHISGQCGRFEIMEGDRCAVATLYNPLETQVGLDYELTDKGKVHAYLIKEYEFEWNVTDSYTSETGNFEIEVEVTDHQGRRILDAENLAGTIGFSVDGGEEEFTINDGKAVISYLTSLTQNVSIMADFSRVNGIVHSSLQEKAILLNVPVVEEKPDYTILWIVFGTLGIVIIILIVWCEQKRKKKKKRLPGRR